MRNMRAVAHRFLPRIDLNGQKKCEIRTTADDDDAGNDGGDDENTAEAQRTPVQDKSPVPADKRPAQVGKPPVVAPPPVEPQERAAHKQRSAVARPLAERPMRVARRPAERNRHKLPDPLPARSGPKLPWPALRLRLGLVS